MRAFACASAAGPRAAGRARSELSRLRADLDPPLLETVRLLVTELVTNSVRHAGAAAVELAVLVGRERVRVEIANPGAAFEPERRDCGPGHARAAGACSWSTASATTGACRR